MAVEPAMEAGSRGAAGGQGGARLLQREVLHAFPEGEAAGQQLVGQNAYAPQVRLWPILLPQAQAP